jgi:hypothetical protein
MRVLRRIAAYELTIGLLGVIGLQGACASPPKQPVDATHANSPGFPTIADASAACEQVQANVDIPVSCETDYVDEVPSMVVGFRNIAEANDWLAPFAQEVGEPFCEAANRRGREARLYMVVGAGIEQTARLWSCELGKWGEWYKPGDEGRSSTPAPTTLAQAVDACHTVQNDQTLPVGCTTEQAEGVQSMIVAFRSGPEAKQHIEAVAVKIAMPFCNGANLAHVAAQVFITVAGSRARRFDCERQTWEDWFDVETEPVIVPSVLH